MGNNHIKMGDQLWQLSAEQAKEVLDAFLNAERDAFINAIIGSVRLDYSLESVIQSMNHIVSEIRADHLDEDQQNLWFMRLGYYFGESLCRAKPGLSWGIGNPEYAFANHPVIIGFAGGEEAEVITITKNIICAVVERISSDERIEKGVHFWFNLPVSSKDSQN
jgi:hypothetical protein